MVRQRYLNLFIEECLKFCPSNQEAIEKVGPGVTFASQGSTAGPGHGGLELQLGKSHVSSWLSSRHLGSYWLPVPRE